MDSMCLEDPLNLTTKINKKNIKKNPFQPGDLVDPGKVMWPKMTQGLLIW